MADSDRRLLERHLRRQAGSALDDLINRHEGPLLRLADALLGDQQGAQDVVQEAFIRLLREADALVRNAADAWSAGPWLMRVLRNLCLDRVRQRSRRVECPLNEEVAVSEADAAPDAADERRRAVLLWDAVAGLTPLQRGAVVLRYRHDLPYAEIAEQLGKSVDHVGVLLHQALNVLRASPALRAEVLS